MMIAKTNSFQHLILVGIAVFACVSFSQFANADWEQTNGPYGAFLRAIEVHPNNPDKSAE